MFCQINLQLFPHAIPSARWLSLLLRILILQNSAYHHFLYKICSNLLSAIQCQNLSFSFVHHCLPLPRLWLQHYALAIFWLIWSQMPVTETLRKFTDLNLKLWGGSPVAFPSPTPSWKTLACPACRPGHHLDESNHLATISPQSPHFSWEDLGAPLSPGSRVGLWFSSSSNHLVQGHWKEVSLCLSL